ncbi:Scaffold protein Nfu/NifU N terminal/NifU-like domain containing protein [Novymonas esmeraldas]|uniref:Scaffold protein Nfu/NifU N terminal/NifU-like domain containing protein n=1 Tax=Novymonas esmeraldas TaxID=1808958 RepID=A0AAW0EKV6_9TRYP
MPRLLPSAFSYRRAAAEVGCGRPRMSLSASASSATAVWRRAVASRTGEAPSSVSRWWAPRRTVFVRFQPTPNEACYKFFVDEMEFLPPHAHTMMFDGTNSYLSPLAHTLLEALPMVEEVTVGTSFVTVRRVEEANAEAAARHFAMRFHGVSQAHETDEAAAAARSQALQRRVDDVLREESDAGGSAAAAAAAAPAATEAASPSASAGASFDVGGFTVSPSSQDEQIDAAALQALIAATDWSELKFHVSALLTDHISSGNPHVDPNAPNPHADTVPEPGDTEVVLMLKELIATTIRPQLQDDGGDLRFVGFDTVSGDLLVELLGACRTCKSSKTTLVDLIERTTRHWIPEVAAVRDVSRIHAAYEERVGQHSPTDVSSSHPPVEPPTWDDGDGTPNAEGTLQFAPSRSSTSTSSSSPAAPGVLRIVREVRATNAAAHAGVDGGSP